MLRIPLPEDDGFALTLPEVARATPTDNFALLALKGRQNTDGGERSVTPDQPPPSPYPLPAPSAQGGGVINLPCPGATRCLPPSVICRPFRAKRDLPRAHLQG